MEMDAADGVALLEYALEKEQDALLFQRWVPMAQNVMSFEEFKAGLDKTKSKSDQEIMDDVQNILESMKGSPYGNI